MIGCGSDCTTIPDDVADFDTSDIVDCCAHVDDSACWAVECFDAEVGDVEMFITGDFPDIDGPWLVRCSWNGDGLVIAYAGPGEQS